MTGASEPATPRAPAVADRSGEPRLLEDPGRIDVPWMTHLLLDLLRIPSPSGRTDQVMQFLGEAVRDLGYQLKITRRGALVADLGGGDGPARAVVAHADTIGCMVNEVLPSGRLAIVPVGTHSARFAEGARVSIFTDEGRHSGTILPRLASGHAFGDAVDTQGIGWDHVEVRVDHPVQSAEDTAALGIQIGDFVAFDALPEVTTSGYVKSRHLDGKAGIAAVLAALKSLRDDHVHLEVPARLLLTVSEEVGHGASHGLDDGVTEMMSVDVGIVAPGQNSSEQAVSVAMHDLHGPFDFHLTRHLLRLARQREIPHRRDVFKFYRSDVASALEAGAATRAALVGFGVDATHGHERTHLDGIVATARLVRAWLQSPRTFETWDAEPAGSLEDFPSTSVQPAEPGPEIERREP